MRAVALGLIGAALSACASAPKGPAPPSFAVEVVDVSAPGASCGRPPQTNRGPRPQEARVIATATVRVDQAVSLEAIEQVLLVQGLRRCAAGISVLRASQDPGAEGFVDAAAELWDLPHGEPSALPQQEPSPPDGEGGHEDGDSPPGP